MLSQALGGLRVVAEQYPQLRATENFQQLQRQLSELEDEIQASRRIYNSNVQSYNTKIQQFPMSIVAKQGGFTDKPFFEIGDAAEREVCSVVLRAARSDQTPLDPNPRLPRIEVSNLSASNGLAVAIGRTAAPPDRRDERGSRCSDRC